MKPVLLLIPGMLNDGRIWRAVADELEGAADVRMADVSHQDSIARMRDDAWAQLADLPDGAPLLLAGFSMGGYVAIDMLAHPARPVSGLLLMSTSAMPETDKGRAGRQKTLAAIEADFNSFVEGVLAFGTHSASDDVKAHLRQMMADQGPDTARRQVRAIMGRQDHRAVLHALGAGGVPVTVLCGRQDRITPPDLSEGLAASIPGARLHLVEDAGHLLPSEKPRTVAQALRTLINHND